MKRRCEPTYRLLVGLPGKSSALDIAARLGLEPSIVEKARSLLHPADAEAAALVAGLHQQRTEMERKLEEMEVQKQELEKRREQLERQFQQDRRAKLRELDSRLDDTLRQYAKTWEQSLEELRKQAAPAKVVTRGERKATGLVREAREEWNTQVLEALGEPAPTPQEPPVVRLMAVGDRVQVMNVSTPGTVTALLAGRSSGSGRGAIENAGRQGRGQASDAGRRGGSRVRRWPHRAAKKFRRSSTSSGIRRRRPASAWTSSSTRLFWVDAPGVRIIHGHGKGILRRTLHEMFTHHPQVEKFYLAPPQEGGGGATIVELKS